MKQKHPLGVTLLLLSCLAVIPFWMGIFPTVRFTRERIEIRVFPEYITVSGTYMYENPFPFPVLQGLTIPFFIDADHPPPIHITATMQSPRKEALSIHYILGRHRFDLMFLPFEKKEVRLTYHQAAPRRSGRYLLSTTQPWKRPLVEGIYLLMPQDVDIIQSNYSLSPVTADGIGFKRNDFMPIVDWQWAWELKKS